jgi:hypothetical protein
VKLPKQNANKASLFSRVILVLAKFTVNIGYYPKQRRLISLHKKKPCLPYIFIENQQMHQHDNFIVMLSQTFLHVSAYQRHNQGTHMILTSYLYVGVHYRKNNGISSEVAPISIVTLWI